MKGLDRQIESSLTDFEIIGLGHNLNLADGHAYQDLPNSYQLIIDELPAIWSTCRKTLIPEYEWRFRNAFAGLANSSAMCGLPFKICPTASNSIDIVGALLASQGATAKLIEPTFDNLAQLLRRRLVSLEPLSEEALSQAATEGRIPNLLDASPCGALILVQPNNPTGRSLDATGFRAVAEYCASHGTILVVDNTFRFYNRSPFDDFGILNESGTSFIAIEDTGKVWPTHDLKASLIICSSDLEDLVTAIYNELYLCSSRFTLAVLERFILKTTELGLAQTIWSQVDEHRALLRSAIQNTNVVVDPSAVDSTISVEWLSCIATGSCDLDLTNALAREGVMILPGRPFFWASGDKDGRHFNVRLALMKPRKSFVNAMDVIGSSHALSITGVVYETHFDDRRRVHRGAA
jgi:aspartate/methionine/tyrosine aminotransferase